MTTVNIHCNAKLFTFLKCSKVQSISVSGAGGYRFYYFFYLLNQPGDQIGVQAAESCQHIPSPWFPKELHALILASIVGMKTSKF